MSPIRFRIFGRVLFLGTVVVCLAIVVAIAFRRPLLSYVVTGRFGPNPLEEVELGEHTTYFHDYY